MIMQLSPFRDLITVQNLKNFRMQLQATVRDNYYPSVLFFIAAYIVVTALSIPGATILTLAGRFPVRTAADNALCQHGSNDRSGHRFPRGPASYGKLGPGQISPAIGAVQRRDEKKRDKLPPHPAADPCIPVFPDQCSFRHDESVRTDLCLDNIGRHYPGNRCIRLCRTTDRIFEFSCRHSVGALNYRIYSPCAVGNFSGIAQPLSNGKARPLNKRVTSSGTKRGNNGQEQAGE